MFAPRRQPMGAFNGVGFLRHTVHRPGKRVGPVCIADGRRMIDAIAPSKDVLYRQQDEIRSGVVDLIEDAVAHHGIELRRIRPESLTLLGRQRFPPDRQRVGIVCARHRNRRRRISRGVCGLPPQHLVAGEAKARDRCANKGGHGSEILDAHIRPRVHHDPHHRFAQCRLRGLSSRHEVRGPTVERTHVGPIETDEVIDSKPVVQIRLPPRAHAQPVEIVRTRLLPVVRRQPPFLARFAERIWRRADRRVQHEFLPAAPDICAVVRHHEWKIAENFDALGPCAYGLPLLGCDPLERTEKKESRGTGRRVSSRAPTDRGREARPATPSTAARLPARVTPDTGCTHQATTIPLWRTSGGSRPSPCREATRSRRNDRRRLSTRAP